MSERRHQHKISYILGKLPSVMCCVLLLASVSRIIPKNLGFYVNIKKRYWKTRLRDVMEMSL